MKRPSLGLVHNDVEPQPKEETRLALRIISLERHNDLLQREVDVLKEQMKIAGALYDFDRFHRFDAILDDKCPCCGGRVAVTRTQSSVTLEAV